MSTNHYRALIALANVLLVLAISYVGFRTFVGRPTPPDEEPPKNFNPLNYEIQNDVAKRSSISEHRITWAMLDRPLEVREVPRVEQAAPVRPPVQDLTNLYSLVMANDNRQEPSKSSVILEDRRNQQQITVRVDQTFDGYQVKSISVRGNGQAREAVVTVLSNSKEHTISLRPRAQR